MKQKITILLFILFSIVNYAQNDKIIFLDSLHRESTSKDFKYIRIIKDYKVLKTEPYQIREYYKSEKIALVGSIESIIGFKRIGTFLSFYENGNRKAIENFRDGIPFGSYLEFYENGEKKLEAEKIVDDKNHTYQKKIKQFWDENGNQKVIDGNGFFESHDKNETEKGTIKNGFKEGLWEGTFNKLKCSYKETYENGKLVSGISIDENNSLHPYTDSEIRPAPKKGMEDFYSYIGLNFRVPEAEGINGKILITFLVDKNGAIIDPKIIRDLGHDTGKQALKLLLKYGNWIPGIQRGQKIRCTFALPITIQSSN